MASSKKIQLYSLATPNGMKISIALEEMGLEYEAHPVTYSKGSNSSQSFLPSTPMARFLPLLILRVQMGSR